MRSHLTPSSGRRSIAAVLVAAAIVASSTSCAAFAEGSMQGYADALGDLPGVRETTVVDLSEQPFTAKGWVQVILDDDVDQPALDAVRRAACDTDVVGDVSIVLGHRFASGTLLLQGPVDRCWEDDAGFLGAIPLLAPFAYDISDASWSEASERGSSRIVLGSTAATYDLGVARAAEIATAVAASLDPRLEYGLEVYGLAIEVNPVDVLQQNLTMVADLAARFPVSRVSVDHGLSVQLAGAAPGDEAAVRDYVTAVYPMVVSGLEISVEGAERARPGVPAPRTSEAEQLVTSSGLAAAVRATRVGLQVDTVGIAPTVAIATLLSDSGLGDVEVAYAATLDDGSRITVESDARATHFDDLHLADVAYLADALRATGKHVSITVNSSFIEVFFGEMGAADYAEGQTVVEEVLRSGNTTLDSDDWIKMNDMLRPPES
jgi:hypothetical protein